MINDMSNEVKGGFIVGMISAVLLMVGTYILISLVVSLIRKYKHIKSKTIIITPEDVDLIREALAVSRINHNKLYENNLFDFEKYTVDQIIALQKQLTTIANQSSAIIEVSK